MDDEQDAWSGEYGQGQVGDQQRHGRKGAFHYSSEGGRAEANGETNVQVAIKIIPRFTSTAAANRAPPPTNGTTDSPRKEGRDKEKDVGRPSASFLAKAAAKDASKEVRTTREGSICLLLYHPYVCGMKSMAVYPVSSRVLVHREEES